MKSDNPKCPMQVMAQILDVFQVVGDLRVGF
jgi:hypothetical protein